MKKSSIDIVKQQIARQTRENIGNVRTSGSGNFFNNKLPEKPVESHPSITWYRSSKEKNRGDTEDVLTPSEFSLLTQLKQSKITSKTGDFIDRPIGVNNNIRYSTIVGVAGGGIVNFSVSAPNSSIVIYVDGVAHITSPMLSFNYVEISVGISEENSIDIYVYSKYDGTKITLTGNISSQITFTKEPDICLFNGDIAWDATMPIQGYVVKSGDVVYPEVALKCNIETSDNIGNLGGIALYEMNFVEANDEIDSVDSGAGFVSINSKSLNHDKYIRLDGNIFTITSIDYDGTDTKIYVSESLSGITAPQKLYDGIITNKKDVIIADEDQVLLGSQKQTFTIYDNDVKNGETYYYFISVFDNTETKNYGEISDTYQTVVAGDDGAPGLAVINSAERTGANNVTVSINEPPEADISKMQIWVEYPDSNPNINPNIKYQEITTVIDSNTFTMPAHISYYHVGSVILFKDSTETNFYTTSITAISGNDVTVSAAPSFGFVNSYVKLLYGDEKSIDNRISTTSDFSISTFNVNMGYKYRFYVSLVDYVGNVNYNGMNRSSEVSLEAPDRPTISNTTNIFSEYEGKDGAGEIQAAIVAISAGV